MNKRLKLILIFTILSLLVLSTVSFAAPAAFPIPKIGLSLDQAQSPKDVAVTIQIIFLLTILSLAPAILIMMTSFTRIIIVLSFLRNALGTQQMPPNQVLIGLALFLTLFIMNPVFTKLNDDAFTPYVKGTITQDEAFTSATSTMREFMLKQMRSEKDLALFVSLAKLKTPVDKATLPMSVVIPAFMISELKIAFEIGFIIFIPFLVIDMIVSSTLMSMGMMMLPPVMISLPFKLLLFIMVDGWNLITQTIVTSFR